jgi:small-conductance mechanosensitive channel
MYTATPDTTENSSFQNVIDSVEISISDQFQAFIEFLGTTIFSVQSTSVTIGSILIFSFLILFFVFFAKLVSSLFYRRILKHVNMDEGIRYTLQRITNYTILILGFFFSFQFIGIDLSGLAVIFGLLSVGIGFGLQNLTSNFISGIILLFERPISVGDRVIVSDIEGDVKEINIRSTRITSLNNISIIVPNSDFISGHVVNYSYGDKRIRIEVEVGVSYNSDLDLVLEILKSIALEHKDVLKTPEPIVILNNFGDSSWDMILRCWIPDPYRHPIIKSEIRCEIVRKFRKHGIEIPFPQRDLHLRSPLPLPLNNGNKSDKTT